VKNPDVPKGEEQEPAPADKPAVPAGGEPPTTEKKPKGGHSKKPKGKEPAS
jgi:hypothetical protein